VFHVIKDLIELGVFARDGATVVQDYTAILLADRRGVELVVED
jgi:hypothetical protein